MKEVITVMTRVEKDLADLKENQNKIISKVTANISIAIAFLGILMTVFALLK